MSARVPRGITGRSATRWRRYVRVLQDAGRWDDCDSALLERLVVNLEEAERALKAAVDRPLVIGSTGQMVANPMYNVAKGCDGVALACARALALTTLIRGAASDDDDEEQPEVDAFSALDELAARRAGR